MKQCLICRSTFGQSGWNCPSCGYTPNKKDGIPFFSPEQSGISEGFEAKFFEQLVQIEPKHFWFRSRNRLLLWALQNHFPNVQEFLEIGCGTGFVLSAIEQIFPEWHIRGSDIFSAGLRFAAERAPRAELIQMDARKIPFFEEFNVIGAFDVLEHIKEDEVVLREINKALKPGGGLLLTVPQHAFLWSNQDEYGHHFRRYSRCELKNKVENAGFEIISSTSFVSTLLPLIAASRWRQNKKRSEQDLLSEFRLNPFTNHILEKFLNLECRAIARGVRFPWGSSLLLAARKRRQLSGITRAQYYQ